MKKYLLMCVFTLFVSFNAQASFIQGVTGAEMAGIQVEVEFADGSSDAGIWFAMSPTAGGYINGMWGLRLEGDSHGVTDDLGNILSGMFVLVNNANTDIMSLTLRALGAGFVFDTHEDDVMINGSGSGMSMYSPNPTAVVNYTDLYMDELYGTMTISSSIALAEAGARMAFITDIDAIAPSAEVPAPNGLALSALLFLALRVSRASKLKS